MGAGKTTLKRMVMQSEFYRRHGSGVVAVEADHFKVWGVCVCVCMGGKGIAGCTQAGIRGRFIDTDIAHTRTRTRGTNQRQAIDPVYQLLTRLNLPQASEQVHNYSTQVHEGDVQTASRLM